MKIVQVHATKMGASYGSAMALDDSDFEEISQCPACAASEAQVNIAQAVGSKVEGLRMSWCDSCGHAYLSRRPSIDWFQRYYSREWDTGTRRGRALSAPAGIVRRLSRRSSLLRNAAAGIRVVRHGLPRQSPRTGRLLSLLAGVGDASGFDRIQYGARLLDFGAGYGDALEFLNVVGFKGVGSEASEHRVAVCKQRGLDVELTRVDDLGPIARHAPFDVVYSSHVFEHLTDLDLITAQLAQLVENKGVICIEVPNASVSENAVHRVHVPVHAHFFSAKSLSTLLQRHGFQTVRVLMDANLHIVGIKEDAPYTPSLADHRGSWSTFFRGFEHLSPRVGRVSLTYDHFHIEVQRVVDGSLLYKRPKWYAMEPLSRDLWNTLELTVEQGDVGIPTIFQHDQPAPPVWLKTQ